MANTERLYIKVAIEIDGEKGDDTLLDLSVSADGSYEVNKVVFFQPNLETKESHWVVFPKEYYAGLLENLDAEIKNEISKAKADPKYTDEEYQKILSSTRRKMVFQDRG